MPVQRVVRRGRPGAAVAATSAVAIAADAAVTLGQAPLVDDGPPTTASGDLADGTTGDPASPGGVMVSTRHAGDVAATCY